MPHDPLYYLLKKFDSDFFPDLFTPSKGTDAFPVDLPEPVGRLTARLEVHHSTGPLGDALAGVKNFIAGAQDVYEDVKPYLNMLAMAMA